MCIHTIDRSIITLSPPPQPMMMMRESEEWDSVLNVLEDGWLSCLFMPLRKRRRGTQSLSVTLASQKKRYNALRYYVTNMNTSFIVYLFFVIVLLLYCIVMPSSGCVIYYRFLVLRTQNWC